jgi:hypothetical protein
MLMLHAKSSFYTNQYTFYKLGHQIILHKKSRLYCHHICGFVYLSFPNRFEMGGISESSHEDHATETPHIYNF